MDIHEIIDGHHIRTVLQPIVDLDDISVVAYEALTRGPVGDLAAPMRLFDAARGAGRLADLDHVCRTTALHHAVASGVAAPQGIFVNVEPEVLEVGALDELIEIARSAPGGLHVVLEVTERALSARPAELLACVRKLRAAGWRVALDDVGADDMSVAFMPLLQPDLIKLDLKLVQERPGPAVARIMNAVNAYAQRSGAIVLAEGIEDEAHRDIARALGATLGQGYLFGHPDAIPSATLRQGTLTLPAHEQPPTQDSPFGCLPPDVPLRTSTKPLLIELSKHLEREAAALGPMCIVVATFQLANHFTPTTAARYRELAKSVGLVVALGDGLTEEPVPGVRGADLAHTDAMRDQWDLVILAPHFTAALLARDLGDAGRDRERRFEFALTYDRKTVSAAAIAMLSRVAPLPASHDIAAEHAPIPVAVSSPVRQDSASFHTLQRALASTTNGVTITDATRPDHPLIYVNPAFERLSGLPAAEILGANCRMLQGAATDPATLDRIRLAIERGEACRETILNYRRGTDEPWWNEISLTPIVDEHGRLVQYVGVQNDVTARVEAEAQLDLERARGDAYRVELEKLAFHDSLTGLLNRRRVAELLADRLEQCRSLGAGVGVLYIDVDDFKQVNDTSGHAGGDRLLTAIADRLRDGRDPADLVARLGGDEFLVVVTAPDPNRTQGWLAQLTAQVRLQLAGLGTTDGPSVSIGTSSYPHDGADFDSLVNAADLRMYDEKARYRVGPGRRAAMSQPRSIGARRHSRQSATEPA